MRMGKADALDHLLRRGKLELRLGTPEDPGEVIHKVDLEKLPRTDIKDQSLTFCSPREWSASTSKP